MNTNKFYYNITVLKTQKSPKKNCFRYLHCDLSMLNEVSNVILKRLRLVKSQKSRAPVQILKLLNDIIPDEYFGTRRHRKLFYKIVKLILTQSCHECIHKKIIIINYDFGQIPWLRDISNVSTCQKILFRANVFLLERVVKPLVKFYYKPVRTFKAHEIKFVRREEWSSFENHILHKLLKDQWILPTNISDETQVRGYLKLVPKGNLEKMQFRPIVNGFSKKEPYISKIVSKVHEAAKQMKSFVRPIYEAWLSFAEINQAKKLFGVKLDIKDAFGHVNIKVLCQIIEGLDSKFLTPGDKAFLLKYFQRQIVKFRNKHYIWQHGLIQGDSLSACLCDLYLTHFDNIFVTVDDDCFLHRTVDDYFFCSTQKHKVANFIEIIQGIHKVNNEKTQSNLEDDNCCQIHYCGKIFDMDTKQVHTLFQFDNVAIRHRFKFWNFRRPVATPESFLSKAMSFSSNSNIFSKMELNTIFNSCTTVLKNFFHGMVFVAYKFDAAATALRHNTCCEFSEFLSFLKKHLREYAARAFGVISKYRGADKTEIKFKLLYTLALRAFVLVLKRRNEVYKNLIKKIKRENNFKLHFRLENLSFCYFSELPKGLRNVKINRACLL